MKIAIKRKQGTTLFEALPSVSNRRDAGADRTMLFVWFVAVLLLWGCDVKDPIYDTAHPKHGKITITTDWTNRTSGIDAPASYTVKTGDYSVVLTGATNTIDNLFTPGNYSLYAYNTAENIAVSGTTATATYPAGALGWFFTSATDVAIEADKVHKLTAGMAQQVRQLTLVIESTGSTTDRVKSITATLSGVAGSYAMDSDTHGAASNISLTFAKDTDGKWTATVRLLGIAGSGQKLTGTITFTDGSPGDTPLESDLSSALTGFNTDKKTPLTLGGQVVETPTAAGFTATITGWIPNSGTGIAN